MNVDLSRICPLRWWHLTDGEQLRMMTMMVERDGYEPWELSYGLFLREGETLVFLEPEEIH